MEVVELKNNLVDKCKLLSLYDQYHYDLISCMEWLMADDLHSLIKVP